MIGETNDGSSTDVDANRDGRAIDRIAVSDGAGGRGGVPAAPSSVTASAVASSAGGVSASTANERVNVALPPASTAAATV